jgi:hypothetical protein
MDVNEQVVNKRCIDYFLVDLWHDYRVKDLKKTKVIDPFLWNSPGDAYNKR